MQQIQLTIHDENEANLLMQLLQKFHSVSIQYLENEQNTDQDIESDVLKKWGKKALMQSFQQAEQDIKEGKVYTVEEAREMMQKKRNKL